MYISARRSRRMRTGIKQWHNNRCAIVEHCRIRKSSKVVCLPTDLHISQWSHASILGLHHCLKCVAVCCSVLQVTLQHRVCVYIYIYIYIAAVRRWRHTNTNVHIKP